jgi:hypothetical protein
MQATIALLIAGGTIWWIVFEELKPAGPDNLKVEVGDLRSYISEAERIIEQAKAGNLTASFFQTEVEMLRDKVGTTSQNIGAEKPRPGLEAKFTEAHRLAEMGRDGLGRLQPLFNQPQQMEDEKARLEEIFRQAVALEKSLLQ